MIPINVTVQFVREGIKNVSPVPLGIDLTTEQAIYEIVRALSLPFNGEYCLLHRRQPIDPRARLFEADVQEGEILQLLYIDANSTIGLKTSPRNMTVGITNAMGSSANSEQLPIAAALMNPAGERFPLKHVRALIGRADLKLGYAPEAFDVELSAYDPDRTVSRPHALIVYADHNFTIRDLYSRSGVLVNDRQIPLNQSHPLHHKDVIALGHINLQFRVE